MFRRCRSDTLYTPKSQHKHNKPHSQSVHNNVVAHQVKCVKCEIFDLCMC